MNGEQRGVVFDPIPNHGHIPGHILIYISACGLKDGQLTSLLRDNLWVKCTCICADEDTGVDILLYDVKNWIAAF